MSKNIDNNIAKEITDDKVHLNSSKPNGLINSIKKHPVIIIIIAFSVVAILFITVFLRPILTPKSRKAYDNYKINYEITKTIDDISHNNTKYSFNQFGTSKTVAYDDYIIRNNLDDDLTLDTLAQYIPTDDAIKKLNQITGVNSESSDLQLPGSASIHAYKTNDKISKYLCESYSIWTIKAFTSEEDYKKEYGSLPANDSTENINIYFTYNQKTRYKKAEKIYDSYGKVINDEIIDDYFYVTAVKTNDHIVVIEYSSIIYPKHNPAEAEKDRTALLNLIEAVC